MLSSNSRKKYSTFPETLLNLNRFREVVHGHTEVNRVVMVRKTDQRTFASITKGQEPYVNTVTTETIETFCGEKSQCKITTEIKNCLEQVPEELLTISRVKSPSNTIDDNVFNFEDTCLQMHNEYRERHGVSFLKLDSTISESAQKRANYLINKSTEQPNYSKEFGENVYKVNLSDAQLNLSGKTPVVVWYSQIRNYRFGYDDFDLKAKYFTQLVWKNTQAIGLGIARKHNKIVVVAYYYPRGNIRGSYRNNVPNVINKHIRLRGINGYDSYKQNINDKKNVFLIECLRAHNDLRMKHKVPTLKLDWNLCKYSQEWANHLAFKNTLEHRPASDYGENIYSIRFAICCSKITGSSPVDAWYTEAKYHSYGSEPKDLKSSHFTQIVWKSSKYLGVGVAKSGKGTFYVVANYCPAGNFIGSYCQNVLPPLDNSINNNHHLHQSRIFVKEEDGCAIDEGSFALESLKVHNEYRNRHGVPPLKLNRELCRYAQEWADICAKSNRLRHRPHSDHGENIFCAYCPDYGFTPTARDIVKYWYEESKGYAFYKENVNHKSLHFTQIIWKGTTELGFAISKNRKGHTYAVANYRPRGNIIGQFLTNVNKSVVTTPSN